MFSNYLVSALRSLQRQKLFVIINIVGLAIGLASCILIILFIQHEFSYDSGYSDLDRLYRIEATASIPGQQTAATPSFFGSTYDLLPGDFEEVEAVARLQLRNGTVVKGDSSIPETFGTADPEFFNLFDFPLIEGSVENALAHPGNIVLTEEMAIKHLGEGPWVNRTIVINETFEREHKVVAVIETLPGNTHFDIDFLVPIDQRVYEANASGGSTDLNRWNGLPFNVYFKLKEGRSVESLKRGINDWVDKYFPAEIQALVGIKGSELFTPRVMSVRDVHMYSPAQFDMRTPGSLSTIYGFSGIAAMIMLIACINFMNLATAASTLRAKEVAIRKVMGASRIQLFFQFQLEALCSAFIALFFALVSIELILPLFADFTERELSSALLAEPLVILAITSLTAIVGLLAGVHPAFVLSGFRPAEVLQSNKSSVIGNPYLRSALVLVQFAISAALIITTLLIYVQTDYVRLLNMGYDNENELSVRGIGQEGMINSAETIRNEIAELPDVTEVTLSSFAPGDGRNTGLSLQVPGISDRIIIFYRAVYPEFFTQFDVKPVAGRLLSHAFENDRTVFISDPNSLEPQTLNVVINEAAAKTLGFGSPEAAVGEIYYRGKENQIVNTIVGVIPNINFGSPRSELDSEIFMFIPSEVNNLIVSFTNGHYESVSAIIEQKMREMFPREQTQIMHLQENIAQQYREEEIQSTLLGMFSGLAILVACMGLFGLANFTISRRTKEIGVRKVMGATSREIVVLLVAQFSMPVLIANVIAWPFCWYAVNQWLSEFNHQIDLLPWFAAAVIMAFFITMTLAWGTVASHAIRVARTSPIFALRYE